MFFEMSFILQSTDRRKKSCFKLEKQLKLEFARPEVLLRMVPELEGAKGMILFHREKGIAKIRLH